MSWEALILLEFYSSPLIRWMRLSDIALALIAMAVSILSCPPYGGYIFKAEIYDLLGFGKLKDEWIGAGSNSLVYNDTVGCIFGCYE